MKNNDRDVEGMIPDYCNDRMSAKERAQFEKMLREDREMAKECDDFRDFKKLYRDIDGAVPSPSEEVFARVSQAVRLRQNSGAGETSKFERFMKIVLNAWQDLRSSVTVPWMFAAVQAVVIALLLVPMPRENTYSTLSGAELAAKIERRGINVVFRESATAGEIQNLLQDIGASVNSGPSREGRFVITVDNRGDYDVIVRSLKQSKIVMFAEPIH